MPAQNARFIVLEGLDGAGTTTQAARLHHYFTAHDEDSFLTREPTDDPVGALVRRILSGEMKDVEEHAFVPSQRVMGLLFAADRLTHSRRVEAHRAAGRRVVSDRFVFSSMAYQAVDPATPGEWVVEINRGCAVPDITLFLRVPVDVCLERVAARGEGNTVFEQRDLLQSISDNYDALMDLYRRHFGPVVTIDGTLSPDDVHAAIVSALE